MKKSNKFILPQNHKATVIKAGKEICLYDQIQASKDDAEIETVLKKYGCLDSMQVNKQEILENYEHITELKDVLEQNRQIEELFMNLPVEERAKFGHNVQQFIQEGIPYYEKELKNINDKIIEEQQKILQIQKDTANNDTK